MPNPKDDLYFDATQIWQKPSLFWFEEGILSDRGKWDWKSYNIYSWNIIECRIFLIMYFKFPLQTNITVNSRLFDGNTTLNIAQQAGDEHMCRLLIEAGVGSKFMLFAELRCTYTEHLVHEISDLLQGFTVSQVTNNVVYICYSSWQKLSQYGEKILYTYVYHIVV